MFVNIIIIIIINIIIAALKILPTESLAVINIYLHHVHISQNFILLFWFIGMKICTILSKIVNCPFNCNYCM